MIDIDAFCCKLDGDNPAGSDLEYDPDFLALEAAQRGKPERQYGETIIPAEPADWKQILEQANALFSRTRDLRVACVLTRALTHQHGLAGLVQGLQVTDWLCREMWEDVYPALDESDDNDPTFRVNALAILADREGLLADIRDCTVIATRRMGACTVRQLEIALGLLSPSDSNAGHCPALSEIDALATAARTEGSLTENHAAQSIQLARGLQNFLSDLIGADRAPDFQPLIARLRPVADYLKKFVVEEQQESIETTAHDKQGDSTQDGEAALTGGTPFLNTAATGAIRSSQDALRMLDLVCAYFEQHEPTNPAPLLLRRAQRLCTMNFFDIVRDMAPDAISAVELVAGSRPDS